MMIGHHQPSRHIYLLTTETHTNAPHIMKMTKIRLIGYPKNVKQQMSGIKRMRASERGLQNVGYTFKWFFGPDELANSRQKFIRTHGPDI